MANKALQQLTHDYTVGTITRYEYRKRRQVLIDDATGYLESSNVQQQSPEKESSPTGQRQSRRYKVILLAVIVTTIIIAVIYASEDPTNTRSQSGFYQSLSNGTKST